MDVEKLKYDDLIVPVPHPCEKEDILRRQDALGDIGMYYPMLYKRFLCGRLKLLDGKIS